MKHIIVSRFRFVDKELMKKYIAIAKQTLIPSLISQINKNFTWAIIAYPIDIEYLKNEFDYDFISFSNHDEFKDYAIKNDFNIQTRHDIDDWMSNDYVDKIQQCYNENINKYDRFLIQAQPIKMTFSTKQEYIMSKYTDTRNSMFLSICQKNVINGILDAKHGQMYTIAKKVFTLPEGYTKWVIHGNNISCNKNKKL